MTTCECGEVLLTKQEKRSGICNYCMFDVYEEIRSQTREYVQEQRAEINKSRWAHLENNMEN